MDDDDCPASALRERRTRPLAILQQAKLGGGIDQDIGVRAHAETAAADPDSSSAGNSPSPRLASVIGQGPPPRRGRHAPQLPARSYGWRGPGTSGASTGA